MNYILYFIIPHKMLNQHLNIGGTNNKRLRGFSVEKSEKDVRKKGKKEKQQQKKIREIKKTYWWPLGGWKRFGQNTTARL